MVQRVANAKIERQRGRGSPVILGEKLLDVVAWADGARLQIDGKGVDLAEKEAGERVAVGALIRRGDRETLLIGAGCGEEEGAGGIERRDRVELVPAEVAAELESVPAGVDLKRIDELPDARLIPRKDAGGGAELLVSGESEKGSAFEKAEPVGMPGMPSAAEAVVGSVAPVMTLLRRV